MRVRQRLHLLEREHAHAVERLAVLRRVLRSRRHRAARPPFRRRANCACRVPARSRRRQVPGVASDAPSGHRRASGYPAAHARHPVLVRLPAVPTARPRARSRPSSARAAGKGTRTVASLRRGLHHHGRSRRRGSRCATATWTRRSCCSRRSFPAYADKTNATAIHAALRLRDIGAAFDLGASVRSAVGALLLGPRPGRAATLVVARRRPHRACRAAPTKPPAATPPPRSWSATTPTARCSPSSSARRASPTSSSNAGGRRVSSAPKVWDERFSEISYVPLGVQAWNAALESAGADRGRRRRGRGRRRRASGWRARSAASSTACT